VEGILDCGLLVLTTACTSNAAAAANGTNFFSLTGLFHMCQPLLF